MVELLFIYHRNFIEKIVVAEEVFLNCFSFNPITKVKNVIFKIVYLTKLSEAGAGAVAAVLVCGSAEPKPKKIFSAPEHCD